MSPNHPLEKILNPSSVAVVGASNNLRNMGTLQLLNTLRAGYKGSIYPIHPKEKSVCGLKAYARISDLPHPVDCAILTLPSRVVPQVLEECGGKGIRQAVIVSGGGEK